MQSFFGRPHSCSSCCIMRQHDVVRCQHRPANCSCIESMHSQWQCNQLLKAGIWV